MSKRETLLLLDDMFQAAQKIKRYTKDLDFDSFLNDEKTMDAVVRNFEIIGEAANRIDQDFKDKNPEIEWKRIRGFRNRIVYDYFGVDYEIVWEIVETYIDELIDWLDTIIASNKTR
ncbi:MAG: DUF86 domain-containing protein [Calditrichaceae bacterium]|nr:DUF86 domain-containing protein [Calditrichaceae bacterium]MBN2709422.1 DUF86 domain-containing protein [Calditrichaceae bacterium]RQV97419.1 MAG: DUF86 domain-containing protein [Calditrichota bacterium]